MRTLLNYRAFPSIHMKTNLAGDGMSCLSVPDFRPGIGWEQPARGEERARWCCEQLEQGRILFFDSPPMEIPEADRQFLLAHRLGDSRIHKNISYRPAQDLLRGFPAPDAAAGQRMHEFMRNFSKGITKFLGNLLSPYASHWALDYASFRPEPEQSRNLPVRKRNDLLHVDAFPTRPTRGGRILRCFTNINPTQPRVWQTTDGFATLAQRYARQAGLEQFARGSSGIDGITEFFKRSFGLAPKDQSPYDKFMLHFHDYLKENSEFQRDCPKIRLDFPPNSTWICFTDSVPHSVISGQYALEQTYIVPVSAMVLMEQSPLKILEAMAGKSLLNGSHQAASATA